MFAKIGADGPIRQGEILQDIRDFVYDSTSSEVHEFKYDFGFVLTQDCDLHRYHEQAPESDAPILIFPASDAAKARDEAGLNSKIWPYTRQNNNPRYHLIERCPEDCDTGNGLPHLMIDFRRFFALQHRQLRLQIEAGLVIRRVRLIEPYREHLQSRAMFYLARVPLDPPHNIA